jgi:hypothetical protein
MTRYGVAAAIAAVVVLTAGCSKSNVATTSPSASGGANSAHQAELISVLEGTRSKTVAEKTAQFTETIAVTTTSGAPTTVSINGSLDLPNHRIGMTFNLPSVGSIEAVLDGGIIYEKIPQMGTALGGKPWFKIDPATLRNALGGSQFASMLSGLDSLLQQAKSQDPTSSLSLLAGVTGTVTTVGSENVGGVAATHYAFQVDSSKALAKLPPDLQSTIQSLTSQLGISNTIPTEAWIDGKGRIAKLHITIDTSGSTGTPSPLISGLPASAIPKITNVTMELHDYGAPVSITVPPVDQVTDLGAMLSQAGKSP